MHFGNSKWGHTPFQVAIKFTHDLCTCEAMAHSILLMNYVFYLKSLEENNYCQIQSVPPSCNVSPYRWDTLYEQILKMTSFDRFEGK